MCVTSIYLNEVQTIDCFINIFVHNQLKDVEKMPHTPSHMLINVRFYPHR